MESGKGKKGNEGCGTKIIRRNGCLEKCAKGDHEHVHDHLRYHDRP